MLLAVKNHMKKRKDLSIKQTVTITATGNENKRFRQSSYELKKGIGKPIPFFQQEISNAYGKVFHRFRLGRGVPRGCLIRQCLLQSTQGFFQRFGWW